MSLPYSRVGNHFWLIISAGVPVFYNKHISLVSACFNLLLLISGDSIWLLTLAIAIHIEVHLISLLSCACSWALFYKGMVLIVTRCPLLFCHYPFNSQLQYPWMDRPLSL